MNEEDTFRKLKRIPYEEVRIIANQMRDKKGEVLSEEDWKEIELKYGWSQNSLITCLLEELDKQFKLI